MSATMQVDPFIKYFKGLDVKHIHVPGRLYTVNNLFLEDVLMATNYMHEYNPNMKMAIKVKFFYQRKDFRNLKEKI